MNAHRALRRRVLRGAGPALGVFWCALALAEGAASGEAPAASVSKSDVTSTEPADGAKARAPSETNSAEPGAPSATKPTAAKAPAKKAEEGKATAPKKKSKPAAQTARTARKSTPSEKPTEPRFSPKQIAGLRELEAEASTYEKGAEVYQRLLTRVVEHHFAERRRRVIEGLEKEIEAEQQQFIAARDEAIRRFEAFLDDYQGERADIEATPDAMFRLAALYEERARADFDADLAETIGPAIALYRRIIKEYPTYEEVAAVHYYLGHAYTDAVAFDEAQQVFRALVCNNRYQVTNDEKGQLVLQELPQDRSFDFWQDWAMKYPEPLDRLPGGRPQASVVSRDEELSYQDPYRECVALPQKVNEGEEPRYVAEVWWKLGNHHFDQLDAGGPYAFNRAASAYAQSLQFEKPPMHGVAMYKLAWTHFKQQRYRTAVKWFTNLLRYADEQEKESGDPGIDFRAEAYTYVATSLTYVDFEGPAELDPYIPRSDVLDVEQNPLVAEKKMRVAILRIQDPNIIPQDEKWSVEVYKALAREFSEISQQHNAIEMLALTLQKFPLDRDAPELQNRVADLYDEMAEQAPAGSPLREEATAQALAARTELARYVGDTDWVRANKNDPEAIEKAEKLVRLGLQQAAADHTNTARALVARAEQVKDPNEARTLIEKALSEYRSAAKGWRAFIEQDPNAIEAYESRFWLADAHYWNIDLQLRLGQTPPWSEVQTALDAAAVVRDSNEDDRFLQPAAYYGVAIADRLLEARYMENQLSGGTRGFARREEVAFSGSGTSRKVVKVAVPKEVKAAIAARDDYNRRIPLGSDPQKNGLLYAFQAADMYFVYGGFEDAQKRFEPLMEEYCGVNEWGYRAWEKLISMSNFSGDADRSRKLVEGKSCAFDEATRVAEDAIRTPVRSGVAYLDARTLYDEADKMPEGPDRDKKWREAASAYNVALEAAPDRDEAPEAAMNGAFAYKQVGEYDNAIGMYELFISRYGTEEKLSSLSQGDPSKDPPVPPDPALYNERVKFLKMAYDALANAYVLFFDYPKAAATFDRVGGVEHFPSSERKSAAQQAIGLYASLGDKQGMDRAYDAFMGLGPSPVEAAETDFLVKSAPLKMWDPLSPDEGANKEARVAVENAMREYYDRNKSNSAAFKDSVEAAYWVAKAKNAAGSGDERRWWQETVNAFDSYRQVAPANEDGTSSAMASRQASLAAEAAFQILDQQVREGFDYDSGRHRFKGTPQEVLEQYRVAAQEAKQWFDRLQRVVDDYASPEWGTAAVARQGTLYDSLRSALYNTRPPDLVMFDEKTEAILRRAEESDDLDLQEKADALRVKAETSWQDTRDREIAGADQVMVDRYARSIWMARRYNATNPAIVRAIQRLAFFTELIGDDKMRSYMQRVPEINYADGMFMRLRPGLVTAPKPDGLVPAAPVQGGRP